MIEINALRNSKGGIIKYAIYAWVIGIVALIIRFYAHTMESNYYMNTTDTTTLRGLAAILTSIASIFTFRFLYYFAKACGSLDSFIANCALTVAYCSLGQILLPFVILIGEDALKLVFGAIAIISGLLQFVCFIILAFKFKRNYDGLLGKVGKQMLYIFYATLILIGIMIISLLSASALLSSAGSGTFTIFFLYAISMAYGIFVLVYSIKLLITINKLMVNGYDLWLHNINDENEGIYNERIVVISEPVPQQVRPTFSERRKNKDTKHTSVNKRYWVFGSVGLLVIAGIVVALTLRGSNNNFDGLMNEVNPQFIDTLMTEVNPQFIDPTNLSDTNDIQLMGWCPVDEEIDGIRLKTIRQLSVKIEFEKMNATKYQIPFRISISDVTGNGPDEILGRGFLKAGNLIAYESHDYDYDYDYDNGQHTSSKGRIILEAKDVKNLAQFNGNVCLNRGDETLDYNFVDVLSLHKAVNNVTISSYQGKEEQTADMLLIKPFGKNIKGVDALVYCISFSWPHSEDFGYYAYGRALFTLIDSQKYMLLGNYPMNYLGVAKWNNEKLILFKEGKETQMYLVDRFVDNDEL